MSVMNWQVLYPEIVLLAMACVIALDDLFVTDPARRVTFWLTQATLAAVALLHLDALEAGQSLFGRAWWSPIRSATCWRSSPRCR